MLLAGSYAHFGSSGFLMSGFFHKYEIHWKGGWHVAFSNCYSWHAYKTFQPHKVRKTKQEQKIAKGLTWLATSVVFLVTAERMPRLLALGSWLAITWNISLCASVLEEAVGKSSSHAWVERLLSRGILYRTGYIYSLYMYASQPCTYYRITLHLNGMLQQTLGSQGVPFRSLHFNEGRKELVTLESQTP